MNLSKAPAPLEEIVFPKDEKKAKNLLQTLIGKRLVIIDVNPDNETERRFMHGEIYRTCGLKFRVSADKYGALDFKYDEKSPTGISRLFEGKSGAAVRIYK